MTKRGEEACPDALLLEAFLSGKVAGDERARLAQHLRRCDVCRGQVGAEATKEALARGRGGATASDGFSMGSHSDSGGEPVAADRSPLGPGTRLGHFIVLRQLGRGGMGVVYLADDPKLQRSVALKVLTADAARRDEGRQRLLREARVAAAVNHPNVAVVYDVGEAEGRIFIAMEYVAGETLRMRIRERRPTLQQSLDIARQILRGLAAVHAVGLVHRDLKPDNVMLGRDGLVKILDFGIAKRLSATHDKPLAVALGSGSEDTLATRQGQLFGTPAYMSPEQALSEPLDARSDVFAFGVVLYEMLFEQRPFHGSSLVELQHAFEAGPVQPPAEVRRQVGEALWRLVRRCLERHREARFQTCAELERELLQLEPRALAASAPRAPFRSGRGATLLRWAAAVGAALFLGWGIWRTVNKPAAPSPAMAQVSSPLQPWTLACPPLRVVGGMDSSGWLGAVAASTFCERARILLGGRPERTLTPPELLGLPPTLRSGYPDAVYDAADAREHALVAARQASAFLDGEVRDRGSVFEVDLQLRRPDGTELGVGGGASPALYAALRQATAPLLAEGALPVAPLDPEISRWLATENTDTLLALADVRLAQYQNAGTFDRECAQVAALAEEAGAQRQFWQWWCAMVRGRPSPPFDVPAPTDLDPVRFVHEAWLFHASNGVGQSREIAERLSSLGKGESNDWARSLIAGVEACFWQSVDLDGARAAALRAVELAPKNPDFDFCSPWPMLATTMWDAPGGIDARRAAANWQLWLPSMAFISSFGADVDVALRNARRAYRLSPENAASASSLFDLLLRSGDREGARAVALRLRNPDVPVLQLQSEILMTRLDASDARFGAALERAQSALAGPERYGYAKIQLLELAWRTFEIAQILGRETDAADRIVSAVVLGKVPVFSRDDTLNSAAPLCAASSRAVAQRCVARLRELLDDGYLRSAKASTETVLRAAEQYARGDYAHAADALRPLLSTSAPSEPALAWLMVAVFDRVGETNLAERIDQDETSQVGEYNGASFADVRRARRHAKSDPALARQLSRKVIAAWETADRKPPMLREMVALAR